MAGKMGTSSHVNVSSYMSVSLSDDRAYSSCNSYYLDVNHTLTPIGAASRPDNSVKYNTDNSKTGHCAGLFCACRVLFAFCNYVGKTGLTVQNALHDIAIGGGMVRLHGNESSRPDGRCFA